MVQHHKYSIEELENIIPFERDIYIVLLNNYLKKLEEDLTTKIIEKYKNLDEKLAKKLIIEDKWIDAISVVVFGQLDHLIQSFTKRLIELKDRYKSPLPAIEARRDELSQSVHKHLESMGMQWPK